MRILVAIPVYNEQQTVRSVVEHVRHHADHVLLIDDGSTDDTASEIGLVRGRLGIDVIRHEDNQGYGRSLRNAFDRGIANGYDWVISMDCDEQHEPDELPAFFNLIAGDHADIISGSRYLDHSIESDGDAPASRREINKLVTDELNRRLGMRLTDGFCGFKAHRVETLKKLNLTEDGYAFPMQLWAQAAAMRLRVCEIPVKLIYNDPHRSFGGDLDDASIRLAHYRHVLHCELRRWRDRLPEPAWQDVRCPCPG
ncbi:MAG: glycosyltransferase family 2 protein, partial [Phycisphaerales bacterium]|nr:glycosyltransferase family 2 protein [Phycisphaerales bacterium]